MTAESEFLRYSVTKLRQELGKIETCIGKLTPEQIWHRGGPTQNAAGNLLLHLTGNVRQWILAGVASAPAAVEADGVSSNADLNSRTYRDSERKRATSSSRERFISTGLVIGFNT